MNTTPRRYGEEFRPGLMVMRDRYKVIVGEDSHKTRRPKSATLHAMLLSTLKLLSSAPSQLCGLKAIAYVS
jgi:hypothetical protein